ncbi:MAG: ornithine carbamoyltransferase [Candidatus Bathyarchaeota archaeon]
MKGRDFLSISEFSAKELQFILDETLRIKRSGKKGINLLSKKNLVMIFQKSSTRTRTSFEVAINQLGGYTIPLNWSEMQLGRGETIADTARTLERYADGIIARTLSHKDLEELAKYANIPVINALSDLYHPCQAISDMFTLYERGMTLEKLKLAWVGDGNNVCNYLLIACSKLGINMTVASPIGYEPKRKILNSAKTYASKTGSKIEVTSDPVKAARGADVIYTDTFISMGAEEERKKRLKAFIPRYQVKTQLFDHAKKNCVFMHCLPARRGEEVVDKVIDGPRSIVWDQTENRLHAQKGLLSLLI